MRSGFEHHNDRIDGTIYFPVAECATSAGGRRDGRRVLLQKCATPAGECCAAARRRRELFATAGFVVTFGTDAPEVQGQHRSQGGGPEHEHG